MHDEYAAWKDGKIELSDLVGRKYDQEWGWTRYERSLQAILGVADTRKYVEKTRNVSIAGVRIPFERRIHWRGRHSEVTEEVEKSILRRAITSPDYTQPSNSDPYGTIHYVLDEYGKWWAIIISNPLKSSPFVVTFRRAHGKGK